MKLRRLTLPGLAAFCFAVAACGAGPEQARLCGLTVGAFAEGNPAELRTEPIEDGSGVRVAWIDDRGARWVECRFAMTGPDRNQPRFTSVATDGEGFLSPMRLFWLDRWLRLRVGPASAAARATGDATGDARGSFPRILYLLQQLVNALTLGCVYALLANGYALIHRIVGRFNLAFGDMAMVGAVVTVIATVATGAAGLASAPGLVAALTIAVATGAACGLASELIVFRPLRRSAAHMPLIASIGLAIVIAEGVRLLQGAGDLWNQAGRVEVLTLVASADFGVSATTTQLWLVAATALAVAGIVLLIGRTGFGLRYCAVAQDAGAAALMGIDTGRVTAGAFLLAGACAGLAGFVIVAHYGVANFAMGLMLGIKALAAAVAGGLGSIGGATAGGFMVAMLETLWSAYFGVAYKDVAVFALLCLVLMVRPQGVAAPGGRT